MRPFRLRGRQNVAPGVQSQSTTKCNDDDNHQKKYCFSNRNRLREARLGNGWREAGAAGKLILGWLSAAQAARLAPAEQARGLAVLEAVVGHSVVALAARGADAKLALHTTGELVVIDASEAQSTLAAPILLLTNSLGIGQRRLIVAAAGPSGLALQARLGNGWGETGAAGKLILGWLSAAQAARLAPAEQARGLAVLEAVVGHSVVALAARGADAKLALHTTGELVVIDASEAQ